MCRFVSTPGPLSEAIIRLKLHKQLLDSMHSYMNYLSIICSLDLYSIEFALNRVNDRFHESGNGIGYLVTRLVLGGDDNALRTPFSSEVG